MRAVYIRTFAPVAPAAAALLIILAAWALRLYHLGAQSLWVDEGFSYEVARQGIGAILRLLPAEDRHPPLHYLLLWLTMGAAGPSEFSLRFVSAGAGLLAIPLTYRLGRWLGSAAVGLVAATLLAVSPFHVWYSQEARMYALLATLGLASFGLWLRIVDARTRPSLPTLVAYVVATSAALYTNYYGAFLLPAEAAAALLVGLRCRLRAAFGALALSALLFLPWLPAVWEQAQRAPRGYQPDVGLPTVLGSLASAYTLGDGMPDAGWLAVVAGLVALLGALPAWDAGRRAKADPAAAPRPALHGLVLLACVLAAPVGAYAFAALVGVDVRATGQMYYLGGLPPFLLLVARGLAWIEGFAVRAIGAAARWRPSAIARPALRGQGIGGRAIGPAGPLMLLGLLALGAAEGPTLVQQYHGRFKEDFRTAASIIEQREWPGDAIILDAEYIFRPFSYYYHGPAPWTRAVVEADRVDAALQTQTAGHDRVWLVLSHDEFYDPAHLVQTWLDRHATALGDDWLHGIHVRLYEMEPRPQFQPPAIGRPLGVRLGDAIEIARVDAPGTLTGGEDARVRIVWHPLARLGEPYHAALFLSDASGQVWWQTDRVPISPSYLPPQWQPGEYLTDGYDVALPLGLKPGAYQLQLKLYAPSTGQALASSGSGLVELATMQVGPSRSPTPLSGTDVVPGLRLVGASLSPNAARPGDTLTAELVWQATGAPVPAPTLALRLVGAKGDAARASSLVPGGTYPMSQWQPDEIVRERVPLKLPGRLPAGTYRAQIGGGPDVGEVQVAGITHDDAAPTPQHVQTAVLGPPGQAPLAQLLGYDLTPTPPRPGETLHLTLYWRAVGETDDDYVVFTHLLGPDGRIAAQRDNPPAAGARPTSSWLSGEVVRDAYDLQLNPGAPAGTYRLEVGMYRPDSGVRLATGGATAIVLDSIIPVVQADTSGQ